MNQEQEALIKRLENKEDDTSNLFEALGLEGKPAFKIGVLTMTSGINYSMSRSDSFKFAIFEALRKYLKCEWGKLPEEDKILNDEAIKNNNDRILARYETTFGNDDIYIITDYERINTMIMLVNEY